MDLAKVGTGYRYDPASNSFVSAAHQRIAEILHDYNPELSLAWIPPANRDPNNKAEKPFAIVHTPANQPPYIAFTINEDELDERVLARIFYNDMARTKPQDFMTMLEAADMAEELVRQKRFEDEQEERNDLAAHVLKSPLHKYTTPNNGVFRG